MMKTPSKTIIAFVMLCTLYVTTSANGIGEVAIPSGTQVHVHSVEPASSKTNELGDRIAFAVSYDVVVNGQVVIRSGETVDGYITSLEKAKGFGKPGSLTLEITSVNAADGSKVRVFAYPIHMEGRDRRGLALGLGIGLGLGTAYLPLLALMAIKGRPAEIETGYDVVATVISDEKRF